MVMKIEITDEIRNICPDFIGAALTATITNTEYDAELWEEIRSEEERIRTHNLDYIRGMESIQSTRAAYKALGKDPSRYRPAAESLIRRVLKNQELYQINTAVDLINLASMATGYSIGGFDSDKIIGDIALGVGHADEPYEGIGRGILNIEGLPIYRDQIGGFGTPTSDHERTKLSLDTRHTTVLINGYDGNRSGVQACAEMIANLFIKYTKTTDYEINFYA